MNRLKQLKKYLLLKSTSNVIIANKNSGRNNFNIAAFLYGVFILLGKEKEYVGLTCPNCIKTILIKDNSDLVNYTKQNLLSGEHEMSFLIYLVRDKDDDPDYEPRHGSILFKTQISFIRKV